MIDIVEVFTGYMLKGKKVHRVCPRNNSLLGLKIVVILSTKNSLLMMICPQDSPLLFRSSLKNIS